MRIHPEYDINLSMLKDKISWLPENIQNEILNRPQVFLDLIHKYTAQEEALYTLVDKNNYLSSEYAPSDLLRIDSFPGLYTREGIQLREIIFPDLTALNAAARNRGLRLVVSSAYRSYSYQEEVYARNVRLSGEEQADRVSAKPGASQHQLGLAIDFGSITLAFADTPEGKWLMENAWIYGFSLSYPDGYEELTGYAYEPWHYRYIGRTGTELEREFFNGIQQYMLLFLEREMDHLNAGRPLK